MLQAQLIIQQITATSVQGSVWLMPSYWMRAELGVQVLRVPHISAIATPAGHHPPRRECPVAASSAYNHLSSGVSHPPPVWCASGDSVPLPHQTLTRRLAAATVYTVATCVRSLTLSSTAAHRSDATALACRRTRSSTASPAPRSRMRSRSSPRTRSSRPCSRGSSGRRATCRVLAGPATRSRHRLMVWCTAWYVGDAWWRRALLMGWDADRTYDDYRHAREVGRELDLLTTWNADSVASSMCAIGVFASVRPCLAAVHAWSDISSVHRDHAWLDDVRLRPVLLYGRPVYVPPCPALSLR
jgi:hypothetical protein